MSVVPDRAGKRKVIRVGQKVQQNRRGVVSTKEITDAIAASGVPDDTKFTDVNGMRKKPVLEGEKDPEVKKLYGKE
jgi:hypothetical protein